MTKRVEEALETTGVMAEVTTPKSKTNLLILAIIAVGAIGLYFTAIKPIVEPDETPTFLQQHHVFHGSI